MRREEMADTRRRNNQNLVSFSVSFISFHVIFSSVHLPRRSPRLHTLSPADDDRACVI